VAPTLAANANGQGNNPGRCAINPRLTLDENGAGPLRALALAHDAETLGYFGIGLEQTAEIATEAVLVELVIGLDVPQPAAVR